MEKISREREIERHVVKPPLQLAWAPFSCSALISEKQTVVHRGRHSRESPPVVRFPLLCALVYTQSVIQSVSLLIVSHRSPTISTCGRSSSTSSSSLDYPGAAFAVKSFR